MCVWAWVYVRACAHFSAWSPRVRDRAWHAGHRSYLQMPQWRTFLSPYGIVRRHTSHAQPEYAAGLPSTTPSTCPAAHSLAGLPVGFVGLRAMQVGHTSNLTVCDRRGSKSGMRANTCANVSECETGEVHRNICENTFNTSEYMRKYVKHSIHGTGTFDQTPTHHNTQWIRFEYKISNVRQHQ